MGKHWSLSKEQNQKKSERMKGKIPVNITRGDLKGSNHPLWKGDGASYISIHTWVAKWKGKPSKCEVCGVENKKQYHWANIDHKYKRVLDDYIRMCVPCHRNYDYKNHLSNIGSRGGSIKNKK